jgi:hypothetical protein
MYQNIIDAVTVLSPRHPPDWLEQQSRGGVLFDFLAAEKQREIFGFCGALTPIDYVS